MSLSQSTWYIFGSQEGRLAHNSISRFLLLQEIINLMQPTGVYSQAKSALELCRHAVGRIYSLASCAYTHHETYSSLEA